MGFFQYLISKEGVRQIAKIALINAVLLVFLWFALSWYSDHGEYVTVPDVRKMSLEEAMASLEERGLGALVVDSIYDEKANGGSVVDQSPVSDSKVKEGRQVFLTIYRNQPPMEKIAIEEGEYAQVAIIKLQNKGIKFDVRYVPNNNMVGSVIGITHKGQPVKPGSMLRRGERVVLTVGESAEGVVYLPNLRGLSFADAMVILDSLNLMGQGFFEPEAINQGDSALYVVCRQDPEFTDDALPLAPGRIVDFWLSKDPCPGDSIK
ncbi:MAG: PASTA domain-containing protein [Flavobacteriales bacterium]